MTQFIVTSVTYKTKLSPIDIHWVKEFILH